MDDLIQTPNNNFVDASQNFLKKDLIINALIVVIIAAIGVSVYLNLKKPDTGGITVVAANAAGTGAVDYINTNLLQSGQEKAVFKDSVEQNGMYKINFTYQGQNSEAYVTRDGKLLFPVMQGIPIEIGKQAEPSKAPATSCADVTKTEKPAFEAFIVSNCPFGTQMQRILAEVIKGAPELAGSIKVRYIGEITDGKVVSMHDQAPGGTEATENLRQICLREENNKYWDYVSCYIKKGDANGCLASTGVDQAKLNSCLNDSNKGLKYAAADFALNSTYSVGGSPTLILNGQTADEFSFGGRTADALKTLLCCGFQTPLGICSTALTTDTAATGFSETYAGTAASNANANANCAP